MQHAKRLPASFVQRYHKWYTSDFEKKKTLFRQLADEGQFPKGMIISCCDSRYNTTSLLGANEGDFFVLRNIANFVPPYNSKGDIHGTASAVEYAVKHLNVEHILVVGHAHCGGVQGCYNICSGTDKSLFETSSAVAHWVEFLRPAYDRLATKGKGNDLRSLEKEAVLLSLDNLMSFNFVRKAVEADSLSLHGLWHDIGTGELHQYDAEAKRFEKV